MDVLIILEKFNLISYYYTHFMRLCVFLNLLDSEIQMKFIQEKEENFSLWNSTSYFKQEITRAIFIYDTDKVSKTAESHLAFIIKNYGVKAIS